MLVLTDLLNGVLNQIMFLWRLRFLDGGEEGLLVEYSKETL
jgi:hypothetical protein